VVGATTYAFDDIFPDAKYGKITDKGHFELNNSFFIIAAIPNGGISYCVNNPLTKTSLDVNLFCVCAFKRWTPGPNVIKLYTRVF
jgi:hypothetical protein